MPHACPFCLRKKYPKKRIVGAPFEYYCNEHLLEQYLSITHILNSVKESERNETWLVNYYQILGAIESEIKVRKLLVPKA